jgi:aerobic carbon-monoxide dehydrogenase small subunit
MIANINGRKYEIGQSDLQKNLLVYLREERDLTGAKNGCGIGVCGACTVLVDNQPVRACRKTLSFITGKDVLTIEGLADPDGKLHPLQQAFLDAGAIQCGYCTPGMVLTAHAFLLKNPAPGREQIRRALSGNLCRCTGYQQIIDAIESAAKHYQGSK